MELQYDAHYFVYMLTNSDRSLLHVGVTGALREMLYKAERLAIDRPVNHDICTLLVYFESFLDVKEAIIREQKMKSYSKNKKKELINRFNPEWNSLNKDVYEQEVLRDYSNKMTVRSLFPNKFTSKP